MSTDSLSSSRRRYDRQVNSRTDAVPSTFAEPDIERFEDIRRFYIEPQATYTVVELAAIWRIHPDDVRAIYHDDVQAWRDLHPEAPDGLPIEWMDALGCSVAYNIIRPGDVELALGDDFDRVRPTSWRTVPVIIRLPQWLVTALENDDACIPLIPRCASIGMRVERAMLDLFDDDRFEIRAVHRHDRRSVSS